MEFKLQSDSLKEFLPHYKKALSEIAKGVERDAKSNRGQYTNLDTMLAAIEPILISNDLTISLPQFPYDGIMWLKCIVEHSASEQFKAAYTILYHIKDIDGINAANQQTIGAIATYQSRYLVRGILGIPCLAEDCDDKKFDTQDNTTQSAPSKEEKFPWYQQPNCITKDDDTKLYQACGRDSNIKKQVVELMKVKYSNYIPLTLFASAIKLAETLVAEKEGNE